MLNKTFGNLDNLLPPDSLLTSDVPSRLSCDPVQNQYGKKLLSLCTEFNMYIANGRTPGDRLGSFTCYTPNGTSVVDLVIGDTNSIKMIRKLKILPPNLSSVHCPLSFEVRCDTHIVALEEKLDPKPAKFKWDSDKEHCFVNSLCRNNWGAFEAVLDNNGTKAEIIDFAASNISQCLFTASASCMKLVTCKKNKLQKKNKPWFDQNCQRLRARLNNLAKLVIKHPKDPYIRGQLVNVRKAYTKNLKASKYSFQQKAVERLTELSNNPREFWKYLNKLTGKDKKMECSVPNEEWVKHFTALNCNDPSKLAEENPHVKKINSFIESTLESLQLKILELDRPFRKDEVLKIINRLRNFKSNGYDSISNEMIKSAKYIILPSLTKLFNLILTMDF